MASLLKNPAVRYAGYTSLFFMLAGLVNLVAKGGEPQQFQEGGAIEWVQLSMICAAFAFFAAAAGASRPDARGIPLALAGIMGMAIIRESDAFFSRIFPYMDFEWKLPFFGLAGILMWTLWHFRSDIRRHSLPFLAQPAFALFWIGICVVAYAQMTGHERYWLPLLKDFFIRDVKRINEETIEILGHLFLLAGSMECLAEVIRQRGKPAGNLAA